MQLGLKQVLQGLKTRRSWWIQFCWSSLLLCNRLLQLRRLLLQLQLLLLQLQLLTRARRELVWPLMPVLLLMSLWMGLLASALRVKAIRPIALAAKWPVLILRAVPMWKERTLLD